MNVGAYLTNAARLWPTQVAVADGSVELTYAKLNEQAAAFAEGLRRRGYREGDRVALFMPNRTEYFVALFGLFKGGFVAVPVNAKLHPAEVVFILNHCEAKGVVYSAKSEISADAAAEQLGRAIDRLNTDSLHGDDSLAELIQSGAQHSTRDTEVGPDDLAWIFYTSGTTGRPKGAMLSHRNLCESSANCLADMLDFQSEDIALHVAPLSHGSGLYALPAIARGTRNLVYPGGSFDATDVLKTMEREAVTIIPFLAPTMIHMMVETDPSLRVPSFRRAVYGGAPIDAGLVKAAMERFGKIFVQLYGQGESPMTITRLRPEDHYGKLLHSVGSVRTNVEVRLVDEDDLPVSDGQEGEVCVRGDVVMRGYFNDADADSKALRGGWLHTGDVGRFDEGYLYLLSRQNDVIISGGTNIYPLEVEDVLMRHPAVTEACVFGQPDTKWGESVVAAVVIRSPVSAAQLQAFCRDHIASFKKPKRIEIVSSLPKNAYGKILRRQIQQELQAPISL